MKELELAKSGIKIHTETYKKYRQEHTVLDPLCGLFESQDND